MDTVVQLVRNALCCVKDLRWFEDTWLWDTDVTHRWLGYGGGENERLPHPFHKIVPLELILCPTHLYACVTVTLSGYRLLFHSGLAKKRLILKLLAQHKAATEQQQQQQQEAAAAQKKENKSDPQQRRRRQEQERQQSVADQVVLESLQMELKEANRAIVVGMNVMPLGMAFFWLFANCLHVTETNWIGGLRGLVNALTVMEIGLATLLYYMIADGIGLVERSARMGYLLSMLRKCQASVPVELLTTETFKILRREGWDPFWSSGMTSAGTMEQPHDEVEEQRLIQEEIGRLTSTMHSLASSHSGAAASQAEVDATTGGEDDEDEKEKARTAEIQATADRLESDIPVVRYQAYREFLYFFLNFIAFYGYLLGIVAYHFDDSDDSSPPPAAIRMLKLGMTNKDADWHGNFAGDLCWTIEPMVILASPILLDWLKPKLGGASASSSTTGSSGTMASQKVKAE